LRNSCDTTDIPYSRPGSRDYCRSNNYYRPIPAPELSESKKTLLNTCFRSLTGLKTLIIRGDVDLASVLCAISGMSWLENLQLYCCRSIKQLTTSQTVQLHAACMSLTGLKALVLRLCYDLVPIVPAFANMTWIEKLTVQMGILSHRDRNGIVWKRDTKELFQMSRTFKSFTGLNEMVVSGLHGDNIADLYLFYGMVKLENLELLLYDDSTSQLWNQKPDMLYLCTCLRSMSSLKSLVVKALPDSLADIVSAVAFRQLENLEVWNECRDIREYGRNTGPQYHQHGTFKLGISLQTLTGLKTFTWCYKYKHEGYTWLGSSTKYSFHIMFSFDIDSTAPRCTMESLRAYEIPFVTDTELTTIVSIFGPRLKCLTVKLISGFSLDDVLQLFALVQNMSWGKVLVVYAHTVGQTDDVVSYLRELRHLEKLTLYDVNLKPGEKLALIDAVKGCRPDLQFEIY
jgi:hypothetical protein